MEAVEVMFGFRTIGGWSIDVMENLNIDTDGGTSVQGNVNTEKDFVGRDKVENPTAFADNKSVAVLIQNSTSDLITVNINSDENSSNLNFTEKDLYPSIKAFNVLRGDKDILWAIELLISNPLSRYLWINHVKVHYYNNGGKFHMYREEPPIYTYNLILSNMSQVVDGKAYLLDITAKESDDNLGRRAFGKLHLLDHGESIAFELKFPLFLQVKSREYGLLRLVFSQPLKRNLAKITLELIMGAKKNTPLSDSFKVWSSKVGTLSINLLGRNSEEFIHYSVPDNSILEMLANLRLE